MSVSSKGWPLTWSFTMTIMLLLSSWSPTIVRGEQRYYFNFVKGQYHSTTAAFLNSNTSERSKRCSNNNNQLLRYKTTITTTQKTRINSSSSIKMCALQSKNNDYSTDSSTIHKNLWSVEECLEKRDSIKFVDGSWYHKGNRNGRQEFESGPRLPGAQYLDMDDISTSKELFPELNPKALSVMFPPPSLFAATMDAMNITPNDQVVVYGRKGCWFTPRTWYLFKTYGHEKVSLMQGSLEDWVDLGGPVETYPIQYNIWAKNLINNNVNTDTTKYPVSPTAKDRFVDMQGVYDMLYQTTTATTTTTTTTTTTIVDTRGSSYSSKGHIPGAIHIPYSSLVEQDNSLKFKPTKELERIIQEKQIPQTEPILLSCGSGVSVCHMALVLDELGYPSPWIYDGSWNEWGSDPDTPKEYI